MSEQTKDDEDTGDVAARNRAELKARGFSATDIAAVAKDARDARTPEASDEVWRQAFARQR